MRIEGLTNSLSQFADIDGFWESDNLSRIENAIQSSLSDENIKDVPTIVERLTQLARVQGLQDRLSEAEATLLRASELLAKEEKGGRAQVRLAIEQGRLSGFSMNPAQSLSFLKKAWELALQLDEPFFAIEAAVLLSISQPPKSQNEWLQRGLKIAEETPNSTAKLWLSQLYTMSGWHAFDLRKYEEALQSFEKALASEPSGNSPKAKSAKWAIARTLRALNRLEESLEIQRSLSAEANVLGKINGHVFLELAECLLLMQKKEDAAGYFGLAYKELAGDKWYANNKALELSRIQHLSKTKKY